MELRQIIEEMEELERHLPSPEAVEAAHELWNFCPEMSFYPDSTFQEALKYDPDLTPQKFAEIPLFTEAVLYPMFGKEDARTILSLLRRALGRETYV